MLTLAACGSPETDDSPVLQQVAADRVLTNGKILTVDADFAVAEALAIEGERFVFSANDQ